MNFVRALVFASSILLAPAALAVPISGNGPLGSFTGSATYSSNGANSGQLSLSLLNTSSNGYLTGVILLNSIYYPGITISLASTSNAAFTNTGVDSGSPFGSYQGGAALGGSWLGGGSPTSGAGAGQSVDLTFNITGAGAGAFTASTFVATLGTSPQMLVRFRGFDNGGSDKVPGVPTPGAAALMGLGGLMASRRRR